MSPIKKDFNVLYFARDCLLAVCAHLKWQQVPTFHYMTNHAILDTEVDKSAYHILQEGPKHHHKSDRRQAANTLHHSTISTTQETS